MHERAVRRAVALGAAALLLVTTTALADTVGPSTDGVVLDAAGHIDLGTVAPGATVKVDLGFKVVCGGFAHLDTGGSVSVTFLAGTIPGGAVEATKATVGPAPSGWPLDGDTCAFPPQTFTGGAPSHVTITAPTEPSAPGQPYSFLLLYDASATKAGALGSSMVFATLDLAVSGDQPPSLHLPAPMTVEGDTTGGATVTYTATATDAEDSPPPTPTCAPASGSLFPLGTTSVACSVRDSAGHTVGGSFDVTVVDTTPPVLTGMPHGLALTTYDPAGAVASYAPPSATDVVDPAPTIACDPAPGSLLAVGTTTVTCSATDHSGNRAAASFPVTVTLVQLDARFDPPVGPSNNLAINPGRTVPVKATVTRDGLPVTDGDVTLALSSCGGTPVRSTIPLAYKGDRWFLGFDTSGLSGCFVGTVLLDGHAAGMFTMQGPETAPVTSPRH